MCELLAMSARYPTRVRLSFDELSSHGGRTRRCSPSPAADFYDLSEGAQIMFR
jgi:hypothetical protein